ncbi:uncharacterized protein PAC_05923 [Phialocephala subalpina]|uniref:Uncharacterized protein n=1 Tax=Phialocephala subalpina TaxID=576137 RepID=A0A1L7WTC6_9HELO|nr:uncharacterized protein PAC_05923 [Phialocephala subalpina]
MLPILLGTLTAAQALELFALYGPIMFAGINMVSGMGADAAKAQVNAKRARKIATKTMAREFPELVQKISSREVRIIEKSFNSGTAFTNAFVAAGVVGVLVKVHQGVEELKRIGIQLEGIRGELEKQVLAMIGVYETTGFGSFVYKFIKTEIGAYRTSKEKHVFYVYHSDIVWVPDFESLREERPLPQSFGGYSSDIDAIFLLMWSN